MSWSTICANASISVTPGSETLWSVHSGQRCWIRRLGRWTSALKRGSSRLGVGRGMSRAPGCGGELAGPFVGDDVEREDQVAGVVVAADLVVQVDVDDPGGDRAETDVDVADVDARLPPFQGHPDLVGQ